MNTHVSDLLSKHFILISCALKKEKKITGRKRFIVTEMVVEARRLDGVFCNSKMLK